MEDLEKEANEIEESSQKEVEEIANQDNLIEDNEGSLELDTKNKKAELSGPKKAIELLMKKKVLAIAIVGGIILFLFIFIIAILNASKSLDYKYIESKCETVTIHYDPYGNEEDSKTTMKLEDYIKSAVYAYTKDFEEPESGVYHLYYSLSLALRNEVMTNNCEVTYRDKVLTENIPSDDIRDKALLDTNGIVMVDKFTEEFIPVKVSDFCWSSYEEPEYTLFQAKGLKISDTFTSNYVNNEIYRDCECNKYTEIETVEEDDGDKCWTYWESDWDEEGNVIAYDREYLHQDDKVGYSLYGSYYLLVAHARIDREQLSYFLGPNIELRTINKEETKKNDEPKKCTKAGLPFASTPLSEDEFVSLVTEFLSNDRFASYAQYFIDYAGEIYNMGREKGVNPELIYIFARKEVGFTVVNADTDHFNYYGMGHCNDCANGDFYASFMEGVEALFDYFAKKGSIENIVKVYSYLGDWLYNFNPKLEQGVGGCYYLKIIYGDNYSRCDSSYHCAPIYDGKKIVGHENSCVPTTDEEKDAYIKWQGDKYIEHRLAIFKLGSEACYGDSIDVDANLNIPSKQLKETLKIYLVKQGTSISDLNNAIMNNVLKAGVGARAGVATAATTLINYMAQFDVRIPYTFGGGHYININNINMATNKYYGADPNWGTSIGNYYDNSTGFGPYTHYGPDCSGFVTWAFHNGGIKNAQSHSTATYGNLGEMHKMDGSYVGQVGDVVISSSHIRLIVGVNEEEEYYITAESQSNEAPFTPEFKGISYKKMSFKNSNYNIYNLDKYYGNSNNALSDAEYENNFRNGVLE